MQQQDRAICLGIIDSIVLPHEVSALKATWISTPLGPMLAIADDAALHLLEFAECRNLEGKMKRLKATIKLPIVFGRTTPIAMIERELEGYFNGTVTAFKTPLIFHGTSFQKSAWEQLQNIPYGQTRSYGHIAAALGKSSAFRAVALANSANTFCIMVPCHRVINGTGALGGYAGGVERKQWLLEHEKKIKKELS